MPNFENTNEGIGWIEEAVAKEFLKHYEYKNFSDIQEIGSGGFGKVYRANWKGLKHLALKSFDLNNTTAKEIVRELKLQREVDFHNNVIRFYGITKIESDDKLKYLLVMEYANGGALRNYLKNNSNSLTWDDKFSLAYQLAYAVSCLHREGIVHRDLHSGNVLIHENIIKLADFGLSKRIKEASKSQSKLFGIVPYVDPKRFSRRQNSTGSDVFLLNQKSDIYSVGVLLWEISSCQLPFHTEEYDFDLAIDILQGHRETPIPNTLKDYVKIYTECWDGEPNNRPTINEVVTKLRAIITNTRQIGNYAQLPEEGFIGANNFSSIASLHGDLSRILENFDKMNTNEVIESLTSSPSSSKQISTSLPLSSRLTSSPFLSSSPPSSGQISTLSPPSTLSSGQISTLSPPSTLSSGQISTLSQPSTLSCRQVISFIYKITNQGKGKNMRRQLILDYLNNHDINSKEICDWLLTNQKDTDHIFLLGYFNYLKIETNRNDEEAFSLFMHASEHNYTLAQYFVGECYQVGYGIKKNEKLAFTYFEKTAYKDCAAGQFEVGNGYEKGIGTKRNSKKAVIWYEKAANNRNCSAMYNLAFIYKDKRDYKSAFELFIELAKEDDVDGISMLAFFYNNGIGIRINKMKAFESYEKAAKLGHPTAQYNLALMYEAGEGIVKNIDKAIDWYKKSAKQGDKDAKFRLKKLLKIKDDDEWILFNSNFHN